MRKFRIPGISALLAFEAAARHENFTYAARELFLTESAVSRQINTLESKLGVKLFVRSRQRVVLTPAGKLYAQQVRRTLEHLDQDTLSIIARGNGERYLELAVLPTFASHWLIPRMRDFNDKVPDVRVNMGVRTEIFPIAETHFEAVIHYGKPTWPRTTADYLFGEEVVPVCAPGLLTTRIREARDLLAYPLLHSTTRPHGWTQWFEAMGVEDSRTMQGVRYELYTMLINGAAAGLGIALVPKLFVDGQLAQLGLVIAFGSPIPVDDAYYLVYPIELQASPPLQSFRSWLLEQASAYSKPDTHIQQKVAGTPL